MNALSVLALIVLLVAPVNQEHNGESEADARVRYDTIAEAIANEAGDDWRLAMFLITVARHESTFKRANHSGEVRSDHGKSWGLYAVYCGRDPNSRVPRTKYRAHEIVGVDAAATARATHAAAIHLRPRIVGCGGIPMCVFKGYGGVGKDVSPETQKRLEARVRTYRRLVFERSKDK